MKTIEKIVLASALCKELHKENGVIDVATPFGIHLREATFLEMFDKYSVDTKVFESFGHNMLYVDTYGERFYCMVEK